MTSDYVITNIKRRFFSETQCSYINLTIKLENLSVILVIYSL